MNIHQLPLGMLGTNCYIVVNNRSAIVIDPGGDFEKLERFLEEKHLQPIAILLTHAHFDHIGAVEQVRNAFKIPVYMHENEKEWLTNPDLNGSALFQIGNIAAANPPEHTIGEGKMKIGDFHFEVLFTPGHSPGSISFYFEDANTLFAGDTLFQGSIGRTDLPFGNHEELILNIKNKIFTLLDETKVCPGHGPVTNVGEEKRSNPFLRG